MQQLIAVATDPEGRRYELALSAPDDIAEAMDVHHLRERLQRALQREADAAATNCFVAAKDAAHLKAQPKRRARAADAGPDQIAFAGTKEPAAAVDAPKGGRRG